MGPAVIPARPKDVPYEHYPARPKDVPYFVASWIRFIMLAAAGVM